MATCKQCGGEIDNRFLTDACMACIERAMDTLTADDIEAAMLDIVARSESITLVKPDGSRERIAPHDFWRKPDDTEH